MALIKPGPTIADIRGSINGVTFSRNRAGMIARQRVVPTNPRTANQTLVRDQMADLQAYYRNTLSATEQAQWETAVLTYPRKNKLGDNFQLTPINLFMLVNMPLLMVGGTVLDVPPSVPLAVAMPQPTIAGSTAADLAFTAYDSAPAADDAYIIQVSPPLSVARNYYQGPWAIVFKLKGAVVAPTVLKDAALLAIGEKYAIRTRYTTAAGKVAPPQMFYHTITA